MDEMHDETNDQPGGEMSGQPQQPRWMVPSLWVGAAVMALVLLAVLRVF